MVDIIEMKLRIRKGLVGIEEAIIRETEINVEKDVGVLSKNGKESESTNKQT